MPEINWGEEINSIAPLTSTERSVESQQVVPSNPVLDDFPAFNGEGPLDTVELPSVPDLNDPDQLQAYLAHESDLTSSIRQRSRAVQMPPTYDTNTAWNEETQAFNGERTVTIPVAQMRQMFTYILHNQTERIKDLRAQLPTVE